MVQLLLTTPEVQQALVSAERFQARYRCEIPAAYVEHLVQLIQQAVDFYQNIDADQPWIGYLTIDESTNTVVGCCGFKGNPTDDGAVEIAYHTFPSFESRGYATAATKAMIDIAAAAPTIEWVIADTLPENNASGRVLQKCEFQKLGDYDHPEDGTVWRWQYRICR